MGSPRITTDQTDKLIAGLRLGMTRRSAAAHAGMHFTTLYRMMERDATLATLIEKAEAEAKGTYEAVIAKAADKNWTAAAWWLERRHPDEYGRRDRIEVRVDMRTEAQKVAAELGLDPDEVMTEANAILAGER